MSHRSVQAALHLLRNELDLRVKRRTAELHEANDALRAEVVERSRAEVALRTHSAALTAAANAIVITDRDGTIVWVNPAFTTLSGYALAEAVVPRLDAAPVETSAPKTAREWFQREFQLLNAENLPK